jgi:Ribonuclease HepT-like
MDTVIRVEKPESLWRCIRRIEDKKPDNTDQLKQDIDLQDILVLDLTRAVQLSVDTGGHIISHVDHAAPQTMGNVFTILQEIGAISASTCDRLKKTVGFKMLRFINMKRLIEQLFMPSVSIPFSILASLCWRSAAMPGCDFFGNAAVFAC